MLAQPLGADRKGRREARIVRVLVPKTSQIVGRYFTDAGVGFVVPDDSRLSFDILIPPEEIMGARMGYVVVVELTQRPTRRTKAVGKIVEVLGDNMGTGMAVDMALRTHEIPYVWPPAVEKQVSGLKEQVPEEAKAGRVDLRSLPLVTIDGEDARDFDDAVYCEETRRRLAPVGSHCRRQLLRAPGDAAGCGSAQSWHLGLLPVAGSADAAGSAV